MRVTKEFMATRKDIEEAEEEFVQRTIAQGVCFACRTVGIALRKVIPGFSVTRHDSRVKYVACQNPDCYMYTDITGLKTWEP
jgi:hypothetical protein